ncbi:ATP-binding protein [Oscillochloris sp. ZM17-4]|uniref:ATP-binding protein n=1 Tax=Oscillochloris sp. ZM17-4 TaxID=2866714 RepID=UPI001C73A3C3|nr:ATP-binding protein [Oscillochloris sp. ZM17-4]MBX0330847.1 ATP-binding protein [Oscillochloris sp. ZM17-4]
MNPFTERSRITEPARFTGRWREVSMVFERIERRRPAMVAGAPGVGKSSLITHVAQSAGAVMELPGMRSLFLDLAVLPDAGTCVGLIVRALGGVGQTMDDLELAMAEEGHTVLVCLDNAQAAIAAGWGESLLERLARLARRSVPVYPGGIAPPGAGEFDLLLVAAAGREPPQLSEPFGAVTLGAMPATEVRLLCEAYLDGTGVEFSPAEIRELGRLSAGHPAYIQRAAHHLFTAHTQPGYGWRAAYLAEARERPVPGAPLPPAVFSGEGEGEQFESIYGEDGEIVEGAERPEPPRWHMESPAALAAALAPLLIAILALQVSGSWPAAAAALVVGYGAAALATRRR